MSIVYWWAYAHNLTIFFVFYNSFVVCVVQSMFLCYTFGSFTAVIVWVFRWKGIMMGNVVFGSSLMISCAASAYVIAGTPGQLRAKNYCQMTIRALTLFGCLFLYWAFAGVNGWATPLSLSLTSFTWMFSIGLICYFSAVFVFFIDFMRDPFFVYSPYVFFIGTSLVLMFSDVIIQVLL